MPWAIMCFDRPGQAELRARTRPRHIEYLARFKDRIVFCGPQVSDDNQAMTGSLFLFEAATRAEAEAFSKGDPYAEAGLFESVLIRRVRKFMFEPAALRD